MWEEFCDIYSPNAEREQNNMEFTIKTFKGDECVFAEVLTKEGSHVCTADGKSNYDAITEICLLFMDILDLHNEKGERIMWIENYDDRYMPFTPNIDNYCEIYKQNKWIKVDGTVLDINDMTDNHIKNCINMIERNCNCRSLNAENYIVYQNLKNEINKREGVN